MFLRFCWKFSILVLIPLIMFLVSCDPPIYEENQDIDVYKPEILNDAKPEVIGTYWEIAKNPDININQKALIEAIARDSSIRDGEIPYVFGSVEIRIEGLGITDLNALKGLNGQYLRLYSTRLNDITALKDFTGLKELLLRGSDIEDFTPIANLKYLQKLDISYSKAKDLSALAELTDLTTLILDKESNFSLEPIKSLIPDHKNSKNEKIHLKVIFIENKLKDVPTTIGNNSTTHKITPTLVGQYKIEYSESNFYDKAQVTYFDNNIEGKLSLTETSFYFAITKGGTNIHPFVREGTYRVLDNLIYFKENDKEEIVNSFFWHSGLGFVLIDRVSFENISMVSFNFTKISDSPVEK